MYRYPDETIRRRLPGRMIDGNVIRYTRDMNAEQLDALGYNEAIPVVRQPHTVYTTEWIKDELVYREQIVTAVVDEAARDAALARSIRAERDRLLGLSDWTQLADAPLSEDERDAWTAYRQELRDVPQQARFPGAVAWPELHEPAG
ncbi:hypothetical protein GKC30_06400 [Pseudodesulfovibrio sp. F-1]|uniref:Phage tail assembly chaperone-like domain-containing protein n=1 Tax=Pseudodesulfovibrio alkaliphilus TaxID=2661613 RepID=A0A7K1KML0_9BACT|nr:tail fiber assembly protein [Pseudodesulfovibrio alkaliphilus]MUM77257.1 hypothetical protein [Pseudodesulfovibrio alkaliphilus]